MWVWHYRGGLQNEERRLYSQATVAAIDYHFYTETPVEFHLHWSVITIILSAMVTVVSNICFLVKHLLCSHVHTIYLTVREHSGQFINRHVHGVLCFKFPCYAMSMLLLVFQLNFMLLAMKTLTAVWCVYQISVFKIWGIQALYCETCISS